MKKSSLLTISGILTLAKVLFTVVYDLLYCFVYEYGLYKNEYTETKTVIIDVIEYVIIIASLIILSIGFFKKNKQLICAYFGLDCVLVVRYICSNIHTMIVTKDVANGIRLIPLNISNLLFDAAMILFVIAMFEKSQEDNRNNLLPVTDNTFVNNVENTDKMLQYKKLLDDGTITQEEFDRKKKELLNL